MAEIILRRRADGQEFLSPADSVFNPNDFEVVGTLGSPQGPMPPEAELTAAQKLVRGSAPSMMGGAIGAGIGSLIAPGPGTVVGGALGAGAGEAIQQFADPFSANTATGSLPQIALAAGLPVVPAAARTFFKSLPGATFGLQDWLLRQTGSEGERLIARFAPVPGTARRLFQTAESQAGAAGLRITTSSTGQAVADLADEAAKVKFRDEGILRLLGDATAFAKGGAPPPAGVRVMARHVPFDEFRVNQEQLGRIIRNLESTEGVELGAAKKLYAAMWDDLNRAATTVKGSAGETLRQAIDAYKRERVAEDVRDLFLKSTSSRVGQPALSVDGLLTRLRRHRDVLEKALPTEEVEDLLTTVQGFAKIPLPAVTPQIGIGPMPFGQRLLMGAMTGGGLSALGVGPGGALGGAAGSVLAVEAISTGLATAMGRRFIRVLQDARVPFDQIGTLLLQSGRVDLGTLGGANLRAVGQETGQAVHRLRAVMPPMRP